MKFHVRIKIASADCPTWTSEYSGKIDELKSMIDIRSKVIDDFNAIKENFPCSEFGLVS